MEQGEGFIMVSFSKVYACQLFLATAIIYKACGNCRSLICTMPPYCTV